MNEKNVFQEIIEDQRKRFAESVDKVKKKYEDKKKETEHIKELQVEAKECQNLLNDARYHKQQDFLKDCKEVLEENLIHCLCRDYKDFNKDKVLLQAVAIASQMELLNILRTRANDVIKKVREL